MKRVEKYGLGTRQALESSVKEVILQFRAETERQFGLPNPDECKQDFWEYVEYEGSVPCLLSEEDYPRSAEVRVKRTLFRIEKFGIGAWVCRLWIRP